MSRNLHVQKRGVTFGPLTGADAPITGYQGVDHSAATAAAQVDITKGEVRFAVYKHSSYNLYQYAVVYRDTSGQIWVQRNNSNVLMDPV